VAKPNRNERSVAAAAPLSRARHPLLDDAAAEICVDEAALGPLNSFDKGRVGNPLPPGELCKQPRLVDPQRLQPGALNYSSLNDSGAGSGAASTACLVAALGRNGYEASKFSTLSPP